MLNPVRSQLPEPKPAHEVPVWAPHRQLVADFLRRGRDTPLTKRRYGALLRELKRHPTEASLTLARILDGLSQDHSLRLVRWLVHDLREDQLVALAAPGIPTMYAEVQVAVNQRTEDGRLTNAFLARGPKPEWPTGASPDEVYQRLRREAAGETAPETDMPKLRECAVGHLRDRFPELMTPGEAIAVVQDLYDAHRELWGHPAEDRWDRIPRVAPPGSTHVQLNTPTSTGVRLRPT